MPDGNPDVRVQHTGNMPQRAANNQGQCTMWPNKTRAASIVSCAGRYDSQYYVVKTSPPNLMQVLTAKHEERLGIGNTGHMVASKRQTYHDDEATVIVCIWHCEST